MATLGAIPVCFGRRFLASAIILAPAMVGLMTGAICSSANGQTTTTTTGGTGTTTVINAGSSINLVGGVSINAEGLISSATVDALGTLKRLRTASLEKIPGDLNGASDARKLSLRRLEEAIDECVKNHKRLPDAVRYLAGLQRIQYVFVYPEEHDIVLVGSGEGWEIDRQGAVVGLTTRRPVMLLDDLLVALRTAQDAARGGISCSINPTPEGMARVKQLPPVTPGSDPRVAAASLENALGMQTITVTGVPATSHFARVLVAADYRMKRLGMAFEPSPVRGLPSYLSMVSGSVHGVQTPRFWLEPQFDALMRDADGLAWELRGSSVKALTEEDFFTASGSVMHSGTANRVAKKWADNMTREYPKLAAADSIFGQLQNCMELAVVGALVAKERLTERAGQSLPTLLGSASLKTTEFIAPTQVETKASMLARRGNWIISASGGVAINSWGFVQKSRQNDALPPVRAQAAPKQGNRWWWN
jgi:hypothetical protein